ncbi:hypothetical protein ULG90_20970 [Halopseudomonas pachastrellae]|nr:hypothetical protein ULG90_20970 [Halopseudomonas pachastrellae]
MLKTRRDMFGAATVDQLIRAYTESFHKMQRLTHQHCFIGAGVAKDKSRKVSAFGTDDDMLDRIVIVRMRNLNVCSVMIPTVGTAYGAG